MKDRSRALAIAVMSFVLTMLQARADTTLVRCEGTYLPEDPIKPPETSSLLFQLGEGKVIWVQGDGFTKIITKQLDADHVSFIAETGYDQSVGNARYTAFFNRKSGDGQYSLVRLGPDGKVVLKSVKIYSAHCARAARAF